MKHACIIILLICGLFVEQATAAEDSGTNSFTMSTQRMRLEKVVPDTSFVGDEFPVIIQVRGLVDAADVEIRDILPPGTSFLRSEPPALIESGVIKWVYPIMRAGQRETIRYWLRPEKGGILSGMMPMVAARDCCVATTIGRTELFIRMSHPKVLPYGTEGLFDIVVENRGTVTAKNVVLTNPIAAGFDHRSGRNALEFTLGDIAPGSSKSVPIMLEGVRRGEACNTTLATANNAKLVETKGCLEIIQGILELSKSGPKKQFLGKSASYAITVRNAGDVTLTDVTIAELPADGVTIQSAKAALLEGNFATWLIPFLRPGETRAFELIATSKEAVGVKNNVVSATTNEGLEATASAATQWQGFPALLFEVVDTKDPVLIGEQTSYVIRVTNQGTAADRNVGIVASFPNELSPIETGGDGEGVIQGGIVTFTPITMLEPKRYLEFTIKAVAVDKGSSRVRVQVTSDVLKSPVIEEESTRVY